MIYTKNLQLEGSISSNGSMNDIKPDLTKGMTPEELYNIHEEKEAIASPYTDGYRNAKITEAFTEYMDLSDKLTRKTIRFVNERDQTALLTSLTSKLYNNIVAKVDDIDFGSIPESKGDIRKIQNYDKICECATLLKDIIVEFKQNPQPINTVIETISHIDSRKMMFERAFSMDCEMPIIIYNTTVLSIIESISLLISACIEFIKTPNADSFQIALDKVAFAKTRNNVLYKNLERFNKMCENSKFNKSMDFIINNKVNKISEGAVAIVGGVVVAGAILLFILNIIPIIRELIFFLYYTRVRVSDFLAIQSDLLEMNMHNLENNETMDENKKKKIISKQLKLSERFRKYSGKLAISLKKAEHESVKELSISSNKKLKIGDITDEIPDSVSSLF